MKLNFLLAMPRLVQKIGDGYVFPIGIPYISASMKKAGFNVFTINLNHREGDLTELLREEIEKHDIDVIGTGGLSPQYHLVKNVLKAARDIKPDIKTICGGGMITADPKVAMEALEHADYGVIGEGEQTIVELANALENDLNLKNIDGLVFQDVDGSYITTNERADIEDINTIPWADYDSFDVDKYLDLPGSAFGGLNAKRMIPMLASRSCPYKCTFCCHTLGKKYRRRDLDDFFAELDHLRSKYDIQYLSLADELFEPKPENILKFCERMEPYGLKWHADFAVNNVREELLPAMKAAGLDVMFFGLESADDRILRSMKKGGLTIKKMEEVLETVRAHDIPIFGAFIFGDIEETWDTAQTTMKWWRDHPEYLVHLTLIKPFPGSQIYTHACKEGIITDKVKYLKDGCPQINISKMDNQEFAKLARQISDAMDNLKKLENIQLNELDARKGRISISGTCPTCHSENSYEDVKLFALDYLSCPDCQQKFHIPLPDTVQENLDRNLKYLMDQHGKIAIWGMTLTMMEMFKTSEALADPRVFPIDISESKCHMDLYGKTIHDPYVLNRENIPLTIISVPSHIGQISCQIEENHPGVGKIVDICELVGEDFTYAEKIPAE